MSPSTEDQFDRNNGALAMEETLRLIARLPAPEGLEDRVKAGLRDAPRRATVIEWPFASAGGWMHTGVMRAAAAAAVVLAIAGGGWGVYSHIQIAPVPSAVVEPQGPNSGGRFSTAGAMHVPQTVEGPVVAAPLVEKVKPAARVPQRHAVVKQKAPKSGPGAAKPAVKAIK